MSSRRMLVGLAALSIASGAMADGDRPPPPRALQVLVPTEFIPPRTTITDRMVRLVELESVFLPWADNPSIVAEHPQDLRQVIGMVALRGLYRGEPIRRSWLATTDEMGAPSFSIPWGKRAVSIPLDAVQSVGGFLRQGCRVDIFVSSRARGSGISVTRPLLRGVDVLAVGRSFEPRDRRSRGYAWSSNRTASVARHADAATDVTSVTFLLAPKQVEKLIVASRYAELALVARHPGFDPLRERTDDLVATDGVIEDPVGGSGLVDAVVDEIHGERRRLTEVSVP